MFYVWFDFEDRNILARLDDFRDYQNKIILSVGAD